MRQDGDERCHVGAGMTVQRHTLRGTGGLAVEFLNRGGIVTEIRAPDRLGRLANVVLGYGSLAEYEALAGRYVGALIGRCANRIAGGQFHLDGQTHRLTCNDGDHTLHGGACGFDRRLWTVTSMRDDGDGQGAMLRYVSPEGEEGYPGTLDVTVTYKVTDANEFIIRYHATTDKPTIVNLTHHGYFNLAGIAAGNMIDDHRLMVNAASYTPVDEQMIPLAGLASVTGTPFDFRTEARIGTPMSAGHEQIRRAKGFDHNWVLVKAGNIEEPQLAARVRDPASGRVLECLTTEPGLQIYTRNIVHEGERPHSAFTLETQHYPRQPQSPGFSERGAAAGEASTA